MIRKPHVSIRMLVYIALTATAVAINLPFFWMIVTSFKPERDVFSIPPKFYPTLFSFKNYIEAFETVPMLRYMVNTLFVSGSVMALQLVFNVLAAYGLSRIRFRGSSIVFALIIGTLMIPEEVTMVPLYLIVRQFGWINSYRALILPFMAHAFGIFLLRQFFMTIPRELEDAAMIDGCGRFRILWEIILPLSKPALWTMCLYVFLMSWNSYIWPLVAISRDEMQLIQVGLSRFSTSWMTPWSQLMAASSTVIVPVIVFFFFVQRQFIEGITLSGLKE